jgi:malate synthase
MPNPAGVQVLAPVPAQDADILSPQALSFLATLNRAFNSRRKELLQKRVERGLKIERGELPDFLPSTKKVSTYSHDRFVMEFGKLLTLLPVLLTVEWKLLVLLIEKWSLTL